MAAAAADEAGGAATSTAPQRTSRQDSAARAAVTKAVSRTSGEPSAMQTPLMRTVSRLKSFAACSGDARKRTDKGRRGQRWEPDMGGAVAISLLSNDDD